MPAPAYPTLEELTEQLARFVDVQLTESSADAEYVKQCAAEAQEWLTHTIGTATNVPAGAYVRAAMEIGAQLFRRRRTWGNIDPLEAPAVPPVRNDPYSVAYPILRPYIGPVMA